MLEKVREKRTYEQSKVEMDSIPINQLPEELVTKILQLAGNPLASGVNRAFRINNVIAMDALWEECWLTLNEDPIIAVFIKQLNFSEDVSAREKFFLLYPEISQSLDAKTQAKVKSAYGMTSVITRRSGTVMERGGLIFNHIFSKLSNSVVPVGFRAYVPEKFNSLMIAPYVATQFYEQIVVELKNAALISIWQSIYKDLNAPALDTPEAIRAWLHNPDHLSIIESKEKLSFYRLNITILPDEISLFKNIEELTIDSCGLRVLPSTSLEGIKNLKILNLRRNQITTLENSSVFGTLECLFLDDNCMSSVEDFPKIDTLVSLGLTHNKIKDLEGFPILDNLKYLFLNHNHISSFKGLPVLENLRSIYLGHNPSTEDSLPRSFTEKADANRLHIGLVHEQG